MISLDRGIPDLTDRKNFIDTPADIRFTKTLWKYFYSETLVQKRTEKLSFQVQLLNQAVEW